MVGLKSFVFPVRGEPVEPQKILLQEALKSTFINITLFLSWIYSLKKSAFVILNMILIWELLNIFLLVHRLNRR